MTKHVSIQPRQLATIAGYRHICDDLEAENEALRLEIRALRAELDRRFDASFAPRGPFPDFGAMAMTRGGRGDNLAVEFVTASTAN